MATTLLKEAERLLRTELSLFTRDDTALKLWEEAGDNPEVT